MNTKLLMITAVLGLSGTASAQLTLAPIPTSPLAAALQADPALLSYLSADTVSFESGGFVWDTQANFALGDFVISTTTEGAFYADVSFLGRDSMPPNHFGVNQTTIWDDYQAPADFPLSYRLSSVAELAVDFWHQADKPGYGNVWYQDDVETFRTWTSFDSETSMLYVLFGIDDLRYTGPLVDDDDFNDGAFLVSLNLTPVAFESPVPEPSTYGLIGAALLVGVVYLRNRKQKLSAA